MKANQNGFTLVEMLICVAVVLLLSSIGIMASRHSRISANEAAAIQELRDAVVNQSGNPADITGASITCSAIPSEFIGTKSGYRRGCTNGVYWATPEVPGRTGDRGFGIDGSHRICVTADGTIPTMSAGCVGLR